MHAHGPGTRIRLGTFAMISLLLALPEMGRIQGATGSRPNILVMMADDMGFSDLGCYGGEIETPHLDGLAAGGLRFRHFYNTARCCPTRAALLTGLYPHQAGIGHMMEDRGLDAYRGDLNRHCLTMAEVLKGAGYATYMSGKWHVTRHKDPDSPKDNWPRQRGFDRFFGTIHGAGSYFDPNSLTLDDTQIPPGADFYYTDAISDYAVTFIKEHQVRSADRPFFLYVAFTAPHWPMHAKPEDMEKYRGRYEGGWDELRQERYERMKAMGVIHDNWLLSPRDTRSPAWEKAALPEWEARSMEVYAAMIDCMDQGVGRIVQALRASGQWENTLIFFLADNGGCAETMGRGGRERTVTDFAPDALAPMDPGALQRDMIPHRTRDGRAVRQGRGVMPGPADTYLGYGLSWANASNTPFREYKHWVHEGGISSPLIVHWPQGMSEERRHGWEDQPAHLIDIMATCVDVAAADYPAVYRGQKITPLEGTSLQPALRGENLHRSGPIFFEHEGNRAVREDRWKLVAKGPGGSWELYDMISDRTELHNMAQSDPERVRAMARAWEEWARRTDVLPWLWKPAYQEEAPAR